MLNRILGFCDRLPKGKSYFRLKQSDIDGKFEYATILLINRNVNINTVTIYPNSAIEMPNINFGIRPFTGVIQLFNQTGQLVFVKTVTDQKTFDINV